MTGPNLAARKFDRAEAADLYRAGNTLQEIGDKFGVTREGIRLAIRELLEPEERRAIVRRNLAQSTREQRLRAIEIAAAEGAREAAKAAGVHRQSIYMWCREAGVTPRPQWTEPEHGSATMYLQRRCRCSDCRAANCRRMAVIREQLHAKAQSDPSTVPHGTRGGYNNWGCRCDDCSAAHSVAMKEQHASRRARMLDGTMPAHIHGTPSGYGSWGCRCDACKAARR